MGLLQILLTAVSLSAVAGGTLGVDRMVERYARPPAPDQQSTARRCDGCDEEEEAESKLLY